MFIYDLQCHTLAKLFLNMLQSKMGTPNNDFMALVLSLCWRDQRAVIMRGL